MKETGSLEQNLESTSRIIGVSKVIASGNTEYIILTAGAKPAEGLSNKVMYEVGIGAQIRTETKEVDLFYGTIAPRKPINAVRALGFIGKLIENNHITEVTEEVLKGSLYAVNPLPYHNSLKKIYANPLIAQIGEERFSEVLKSAREYPITDDVNEILRNINDNGIPSLGMGWNLLEGINSGEIERTELVEQVIFNDSMIGDELKGDMLNSQKAIKDLSSQESKGAGADYSGFRFLNRVLS